LIPSSQLKSQWSFNKNDFDNITDSTKYNIQRKRMNEANNNYLNQNGTPLGYGQIKAEEPRVIKEVELDQNRQKTKGSKGKK
jgi:hypothetical protein